MVTNQEKGLIGRKKAGDFFTSLSWVVEGHTELGTKDVDFVITSVDNIRYGVKVKYGRNYLMYGKKIMKMVDYCKAKSIIPSLFFITDDNEYAFFVMRQI